MPFTYLSFPFLTWLFSKFTKPKKPEAPPPPLARPTSPTPTSTPPIKDSPPYIHMDFLPQDIFRNHFPPHLHPTSIRRLRLKIPERAPDVSYAEHTRLMKIERAAMSAHHEALRLHGEIEQMWVVRPGPQRTQRTQREEDMGEEEDEEEAGTGKKDPFRRSESRIEQNIKES